MEEGATTVPTAVPAGAVVVAASDGAGVGTKVEVKGTTLLLGKGPSETVMTWLGVAV